MNGLIRLNRVISISSINTNLHRDVVCSIERSQILDKLFYNAKFKLKKEFIPIQEVNVAIFVHFNMVAVSSNMQTNLLQLVHPMSITSDYLSKVVKSMYYLYKMHHLGSLLDL